MPSVFEAAFPAFRQLAPAEAKGFGANERPAAAAETRASQDRSRRPASLTSVLLIERLPLFAWHLISWASLGAGNLSVCK